MTADPFTDVAQWLDLDPHTESMMRHPAGKGLTSREVQDWQDQQACALGSSNHQPAEPEPAPEPAPTVAEHVRHVGGLIAMFALVANTGPILHGLQAWIA